MAEIYQLPENSGNNGGFGNIPFSIPIGGFGMGGGLFGGNYGMNGIADLFGLAIIASMSAYTKLPLSHSERTLSRMLSIISFSFVSISVKI